MTPAVLRQAAWPALLLSGLAAGCAALAKPPAAVELTPAVLTVETPAPVTVVAIPEPLPLPGQLKPALARAPDAPDPRVRVGAANAAARVQPAGGDFVNAIQRYPWSEGALYQVYAAPGQVTDIALQAGEQLVGSGPVAAGDTARWIIGDTESGEGAGRQVHILVKPTAKDLATNLVINTDRRTYHLELRATAATYMASVSWTYPQDALIALRGQAAGAASAQPVATGLDIAALRFGYEIVGDHPAWRPLRVFDDGRQVFIEFPAGIGQGEMPPLFVVGAGGTGELVNYRVQGRHMVVDRLFEAAELRLGDRRSQQRVRLLRADGAGRR